MARFQRFLIAQVLDGHEFVHTIDAGPAKGLVYPVLMPDDKGVWTGSYEHELSRALATTVRHGDVCFDVGGWRGYFGAVMALAGARQVIIFEPLSTNCDRIDRLRSLNPHLPLQLERVAVGDLTGEAEFRVMEATSMGKLADSSFQRDCSQRSTIHVPIVALDDWCAGHDMDGCEVLKIDVEGAELMVLLGARQLIRRRQPTVFVEVHSRELMAGIKGFLDSMDYEILVLETCCPPNGVSEPEICHITASPIAHL